VQRSILEPFQTRYGLTTASRQQRKAPILWRHNGAKREALKHAQTAANTLRQPVYVVERDEGLPDYYTIVQPQ
jgi:hypothetical protein